MVREARTASKLCSKKIDVFHGAVKDSVDAAGIYVEELDDSASED
jgi:hypothetical protein